MLGWLAQLAQVALVCLPVIASFMALAGAAATLYGAIVAIDGISIAVSSGMTAWIGQLTDVVSGMASGGSNLSWIIVILRAMDFPTFLSLLVDLVVVVINVFLGFAAIGSAVLVAAGTVWLFRKIKLLANVLAGQGAME